MTRVIIIEDEKNAANLLEVMLNDIDPYLEILEKCTNLPSGVKSIKKNIPDIIFLDIELPVYSGIQLLDFFNTEEINFDIIFTTASNEYAVRAFEMSAIDYLMKPIQEEKLRTALDKVSKRHSLSGKKTLPLLQENFHNSNTKKIVVPIANGYEILNSNNICFLKAEGSYTKIYFEEKTCLLVSKNLKHFEFILFGLSNFIRIHRSFIANMNFAKKLLRKDGGTLFMKDQTELPVSDDKMDLLLEKLYTL